MKLSPNSPPAWIVGDVMMSDSPTAEPVELDLEALLGFRDISGLGDDAGLIAEELDAAHVKIGVSEIILESY